MRARDRDDPPGAGAEHGLREGLVGIGGAKERQRERFAALPDGTFVWTRDTQGTYHLGRISGPMRGDEASPVGLTDVRDAAWLDRPFGEDEVPPDVAATFARGGRNLQRTHSPGAEARTAELWRRYGR